LKEVWGSEGWGRNFEDTFKWKVGNGKEISFWEDCWTGNEALKKVYPRFFSLSSSKKLWWWLRLGKGLTMFVNGN